jgi:lysophospholipase L1-like esterase
MGKVWASLILVNMAILFFESKVSAGKLVTVWIIGDSTASSYSPDVYPRMGWGQTFGEFFGKGAVVRNEAISGRSTKSFLDEGDFARVIGKIRPGDYLLMQFGHNDEKIQDPKRYTDPPTYCENLSYFARAAGKAGAHPVIITPVERRLFSGGVPAETHGDYPAAARKAAADTGTPCIDLNAMSRDLYASMGEEDSKVIFLILGRGLSPNYPEGIDDNTHLKTEGARIIGQLVVDGLRNQSIPLAGYVKKSFLKQSDK